MHCVVSKHHENIQINVMYTIVNKKIQILTDVMCVRCRVQLCIFSVLFIVEKKKSVIVVVCSCSFEGQG